ncbi:MAG: hypothetical protein AVDCRST_MAG89-4754, partial [uncultured Gemmatimonadetes bacterium]
RRARLRRIRARRRRHRAAEVRPRQPAARPGRAHVRALHAGDGGAVRPAGHGRRRLLPADDRPADARLGGRRLDRAAHCAGRAADQSAPLRHPAAHPHHPDGLVLHRRLDRLPRQRAPARKRSRPLLDLRPRPDGDRHRAHLPRHGAPGEDGV